MPPSLHDPSIVQDRYLVRTSDSGEPVRDDYRGPSFHQAIQSLLDNSLTLGVEGTCRLVK
jgi:hypothetical protein